MLPRRYEIGIGLFTLVFAILLLTVLIPMAVASPETVASMVLSPLFWPTVLGGVLLVAGIALTVKALVSRPDPALETGVEPWERGQVARIAAFIILIVVYYVSIPVLGLVWASMVAFIAMRFVPIGRSMSFIGGIVCAVVLPLLL